MPDLPSQGTPPRVTVFTSVLASLTAIAIVTIPLVWNNRSLKIEDERQNIERLNNNLASANDRIKGLEKQSEEIRRELLRRPLTSNSMQRHIVAKDEEINVEFTAPLDRDSLPRIIDVAFTTTGRIPSGYQSVLLIRDPRGKYWSFGPVPLGRAQNVTLGDESEQHGAPFEIGVLITNEEIPGNKALEQLPRNLLYKKISVTRK